VLLEVPAGGINHGEVSEATVLRELQEETGFTAATLRHLSSFWVSPGWCTEQMHAYLATGLAPSRLEADYDENITVEHVPLARIPELIAAGEIQDAKSIAALLLALRALGDRP
jgi:ADP-ribose pyrophosphatase